MTAAPHDGPCALELPNMERTLAVLARTARARQLDATPPERLYGVPAATPPPGGDRLRSVAAASPAACAAMPLAHPVLMLGRAQGGAVA